MSSLWKPLSLRNHQPPARGGHALALGSMPESSASDEKPTSSSVFAILHGGADPHGVPWDRTNLVDIDSGYAIQLPLKGNGEAGENRPEARVSHALHGIPRTVVSTNVEESSLEHPTDRKLQKRFGAMMQPSETVFVLFGGSQQLPEFKLFDDVWLLQVIAPMVSSSNHAGETDEKEEVETEEESSTSAERGPTFLPAGAHGSWTKLECTGTAPGGRHSFGSTVVGDRHLFVLGGALADSAVDDAHSLDMKTRVWRKVNVGAMLGTRFMHSVVFNPFLNQLFVVGGLNGTQEPDGRVFASEHGQLVSELLNGEEETEQRTLLLTEIVSPSPATLCACGTAIPGGPKGAGVEAVGCILVGGNRPGMDMNIALDCAVCAASSSSSDASYGSRMIPRSVIKENQVAVDPAQFGLGHSCAWMQAAPSSSGGTSTIIAVVAAGLFPGDTLSSQHFYRYQAHQ